MSAIDTFWAQVEAFAAGGFFLLVYFILLHYLEIIFWLRQPHHFTEGFSELPGFYLGRCVSSLSLCGPGGASVGGGIGKGCGKVLDELSEAFDEGYGRESLQCRKGRGT